MAALRWNDHGVSTAIVSDLHLGSGNDEDLLRHGPMRRRLFERLAGVDRVVLLGDVIELRDRPLAETMEIAISFFAELGDAMDGRELVLVPGGSLITPGPEEGRALALTLARHTIHNIQPDLDLLKAGRATYGAAPDSLIAASHVVAVEFATIARDDVPQCKSAAVDQYPACFGIEPGFVGHIHLDMLAEDDVEGGVGEWQFGDVCLAHGNAIVQPDEPIEPTGCFAILVSQIDGRHPTPALFGDQTGGTADTAAGVEHILVADDVEQVHQLAGGDAAHGVEILKRCEVCWPKMWEFQARRDEGTFDVLPC